MSSVTARRGDTWRMTFKWRDEDGSPIDLTGASSRLQLRRNSRGPVVLEATSADGKLTVGDNGEVILAVPAGEMAAIQPGSYVADIEMTYSDNTVQSSDPFEVVIVEDITQ